MARIWYIEQPYVSLKAGTKFEQLRLWKFSQEGYIKKILSCPPGIQYGDTM